MREYQHTPGCLLRFLREQLDDPDAADCGRCSRCLGHPAAGVAAVQRRRRSRGALASRRRAGGEEDLAHRHGRAAASSSPDASPRAAAAAEGRALARLSDLGWGDRLAGALAADGEPSPALMSGVVSTLARLAVGEPAGGGRRRSSRSVDPLLVSSLAAQVAEVGRLVDAGVGPRRRRSRRPQAGAAQQRPQAGQRRGRLRGAAGGGRGGARSRRPARRRPLGFGMDGDVGSAPAA